MESIAAVFFYLGLAIAVFGTIRVVRASLERGPARDVLGIGAIALGAALLILAVGLFSNGPRRVLPF